MCGVSECDFNTYHDSQLVLPTFETSISSRIAVSKISI